MALARSLVHIVNPLWDACGGADWRSIETWKLLRSRCEVRLWSEYEPHPRFEACAPIERIHPWRLRFPRGGTLIFVGVYFRVGHWVRFAAPERVVVVYNTSQADRLRKNLARIASCGRTPEVMYTSHVLRRLERGHGPVLESAIDMARFPYRERDASRPFTVGRLSRDTPTKHHEEDVRLWRALAAEGVRVRILGGMCLAAALGGLPNVELLPAGAEDAFAFLQSLDCFVYRTSERWLEAFGRVVIEAMATGLPVVCGDRGGYVDYVTHGRDAMVVGSTAQALDAIRRLRTDRWLARSLGLHAAKAARRLQGELVERTLRLLGGASPAPAAARIDAESVGSAD
jgi:glycosyltransferase involved in cell wall biosynthesis